MKKRALSLLLVFVMALGLAAPALAEGDLFLAEEPAAPEDMGAAAPADPVPAEAEAEVEPADAPVDVPAPIAAAPMEADIPMPAANFDGGGAEDFKAAWETATSGGDTIDMSANATVGEYTLSLDTEKDITVNGGSHSIEGSKTVFEVKQGSLTLSGVTVYSVGSDAAIVVSGSGKLTIDNAGVKVGTAGTSNNGKAISVTGGTVDISAGSFGELNVSGSPTVQLSGGHYDKITYSGEAKTLLKDGYAFFEGDGSSNKAADLSSLTNVTVKAKVPASGSAPTAANPTYTGEAQNLVTGGSATGGTMQYAVTEEKSKPGDGYSPVLPQKTNAGTYYVWWKVVGDAAHTDYDPGEPDNPVQVTIAKAGTTVELARTVPSGDVTYGDTVTLTATVKASGVTGEYVPTGKVTLMQNEEPAGEAIAPTGTAGSWTAEFTLTNAQLKKAIDGETTFKATFAGDKNLADNSEGSTLTVTVSKKPIKATDLTFTSDGKTYDKSAELDSMKYELGFQDGVVETDSDLDDLKITSTKATLGGADANDSYTSVTVEGLALSGADSKYYELKDLGGSDGKSFTLNTGVSVKITPATVTFPDDQTWTIKYGEDENDTITAGCSPGSSTWTT